MRRSHLSLLSLVCPHTWQPLTLSAVCWRMLRCLRTNLGLWLWPWLKSGFFASMPLSRSNRYYYESRDILWKIFHKLQGTSFFAANRHGIHKYVTEILKNLLCSIVDLRIYWKWTICYVAFCKAFRFVPSCAMNLSSQRLENKKQEKQYSKVTPVPGIPT